MRNLKDWWAFPVWMPIIRVWAFPVWMPIIRVMSISSLDANYLYDLWEFPVWIPNTYTSYENFQFGCQLPIRFMRIFSLDTNYLYDLSEFSVCMPIILFMGISSLGANYTIYGHFRFGCRLKKFWILIVRMWSLITGA